MNDSIEKPFKCPCSKLNDINCSAYEIPYVFKSLMVLNFFSELNISMENNTPHSKTSYNVNSESKCPFSGGSVKKGAGSGTSNRDWWPHQL
ncbi:MAG: hypothetical protein ACK56I_33905, partial [bacterium]